MSSAGNLFNMQEIEDQKKLTKEFFLDFAKEKEYALIEAALISK